MATAKKKPAPKTGAKKHHTKKVTGLTKAAHTAKKKHKKKKKLSMMAEMISPQRMKENAQATLSGGIGGGVAHVIYNLIPATWGNGARIITGAAASFIVGAVLDKPNTAAGIAGGFGYAIVDKKMLADNDDDDTMEDGEFTDAEVLEEMPEYLSTDGTALCEDADGQLVALSNAEVIQLQERMQYYAPYNRQA